MKISLFSSFERVSYYLWSDARAKWLYGRHGRFLTKDFFSRCPQIFDTLCGLWYTSEHSIPIWTIRGWKTKCQKRCSTKLRWYVHSVLVLHMPQMTYWLHSKAYNQNCATTHIQVRKLRDVAVSSVRLLKRMCTTWVQSYERRFLLRNNSISGSTHNSGKTGINSLQRYQLYNPDRPLGKQSTFEWILQQVTRSNKSIGTSASQTPTWSSCASVLHLLLSPLFAVI